MFSDDRTNRRGPHTFHIPVMGTGFTLDTPIRIGHFGISSVISLVDDQLIEQMRKYYSEREGFPYTEITDSEPDPRAARITAYLNLAHDIQEKHSNELRNSRFEKGSLITKYYEMLPESPLKEKYRYMLAEKDPARQEKLTEELRALAVPGSIDVNIMTKLDCQTFKNGQPQPIEFNDAMSAFRGYAMSKVSSSIVFSAGLNQHLYSYIAQFSDFIPDANGHSKKRIILKVSDYRSAEIQGKVMAKKGLWISEYRIESGLNCGGHAFATKGQMMGPILEEFRTKRDQLSAMLLTACNAARKLVGLPEFATAPLTMVTVQGGIGTHHEDQFLQKHYAVDKTGWGSPFLLVPEAVCIDEEHIRLFIDAGPDDVYLSEASPMGIPFWNLRTSGSERMRRDRIAKGKPGSPCPKRYLAFNSEFSKIPICTAAAGYQQRKLPEIEASDKPASLKEFLKQAVLNKSCICHDLGGSAKIATGIDKTATPAICPGPNILFFKKRAKLEEMIDHIYGRASLFAADTDRPHMFINEMKIYMEHIKKEMEQISAGLITKTPKYYQEFKVNMLEGMEYYKDIAKHFKEEQKDKFLAALDKLRTQIEEMIPSGQHV